MDTCKIRKFSGSGREIGLSIGKVLKNNLEILIDRFIDITNKAYGLDFSNLGEESLFWLNKIPLVYLEELEGLAEGSGCSLTKIAQWIYCDRSIGTGCTSFIYNFNGLTWVGRNNDYIGPKMWDCAYIISKTGFIPVMLFGPERSTFSGTGYNAEKLWLHYNWLPVWDINDVEDNALSPFIFIRTALESCRNLSEVEMLLRSTTRDGGMNLFAVDGKDNSFCVYECSRKAFVKRKIENGWVVGTNHYNSLQLPMEFEYNTTNSVFRQAKVENFLKNINIKRLNTEKIHEDLIEILADPEIECCNEYSGTVYSNIACPALDALWYACDGFPAASKSKWEKLNWTW